MRTRKSTNTNRTYYDRDASGNLVHEFRDYSGYLGEDSHLYYYYDANGSIGSISYNGVRYAFRKNLQGDVIAILDTSGNVVARYTYDAWGKVLSVTDADGNANTSSTFIGNVNPIRYRGYYYDTETGWYYLNSRYYDPEVKRFINADGIIGANGTFTGYNLFAYCNNDPVNWLDASGLGMSDYRYSSRVPGGYPEYGVPKYENTAVVLGVESGPMYYPPNIGETSTTVTTTTTTTTTVTTTTTTTAQSTSDTVWPTDSKRLGDGINCGCETHGGNHKGQDIMAVTPGVKGDNVYAAITGVAQVPSYSNSAGNYVIVENSKYVTRYLHLDSVSVSNGAVVNAGTIIGKMGTTGQSTGVHLHFDVWDKEAGTYVDPLLFY